jgi:hypothetical protein
MTIGYDKILITVLGFFILMMSPGCCMIIPAKPIQTAYIATEPPYTARLMFPYKDDEVIRKLKIYEYKTIERFPFSRRTTCWYIKAMKPVLAKGFRVTIGNVPNDFEQVVPEQSMPFVPIPDSIYLVEIITTNHNVCYLTGWKPGSLSWRF